MERTVESRSTGLTWPPSEVPERGGISRRRRLAIWGGLLVALAGSLFVLYRTYQRGAADLKELVHQVALEEGVPPLLAEAVVQVESSGRPRAVSRAEAYGLMQLQPSTAAYIAGRAVSEKELFDPRFNVQLGCRYLGSLLKRYRGDLRLALMAYNAGPTRLDRWRELEPDPRAILRDHAYGETRAYVTKVLAYVREHQ